MPDPICSAAVFCGQPPFWFPVEGLQAAEKGEINCPMAKILV